MLPTTCHCTRLRRAAHAVTRHYDLALAESGLTTTQFSLMRTISRLDQPYISTLADATGLERSTLGRNLRPLEKAGLVEFGQGEDARTRLVRLTRKGKRTLNDAVAQWQVAQDRLNAVLGDKKLTALESLLDEVIAS
jgi:DNA-binding MarR family transcriptional regulator